jgi:hypothetical protein
LGDTFTWVGLALLSYQFGKENAAVILASALTLRVVALFCFLLLQEYWLTKSTEEDFILGRKAFQRPLEEGIALLNAVQDVYLAKEIDLA